MQYAVGLESDNRASALSSAVFFRRRTMSNRSRSLAPSPFSHRVLVAVAIGIALGSLAILLWWLVYVLLLVFAGVLFAILLRTAADWLQSVTRLPNGWALGLTIVLLLIGTMATGWFLVPRVGAQLDELGEQLPQRVEEIESQLKEYRWGVWLLDRKPEDLEILGQATGVLSTGLGALFALVITLSVGGYLAVDPWLYTNGILLLVPPRHRPRARDILAALGYTLRWWLIGQLVAMTAVGIMTAFGLWLLGVPLWLTLGLLAFLLDFVPYVGPIVAAVPGVLLALAESPTKAIYVTIMYIVVQQIESLLLIPFIQKRAVLLPPVLTIISQVVMAVLAGFLGIVFATPLMAVVMILVKMIYVEEILGQELPTPDDEIPEKDMPPLPHTSPVEGRSRSAPDHEEEKRPPPVANPATEN